MSTVHFFSTARVVFEQLSSEMTNDAGGTSCPICAATAPSLFSVSSLALLDAVASTFLKSNLARDAVTEVVGVAVGVGVAVTVGVGATVGVGVAVVVGVGVGDM